MMCQKLNQVAFEMAYGRSQSRWSTEYYSYSRFPISITVGKQLREALDAPLVSSVHLLHQTLSGVVGIKQSRMKLLTVGNVLHV